MTKYPEFPIYVHPENTLWLFYGLLTALWVSEYVDHQLDKTICNEVPCDDGWGTYHEFPIGQNGLSMWLGLVLLHPFQEQAHLRVEDQDSTMHHLVQNPAGSVVQYSFDHLVDSYDQHWVALLLDILWSPVGWLVGSLWVFDPGTEIHQCLIGMEMSVVLGIPLGPAGDHVPGRIKVSPCSGLGTSIQTAQVG